MCGELKLVIDQNNANNANNVTTSKHKQNVKLPTITLPEFSGNILEWIQFKECFTAAVNDSNLTDVEKFVYLKGQLKSEAYNTISGLSLTNSNYHHALELLEKRYGDPNVCIRAHVRELLHLETVADNKITSLKLFLDKINTNIRSLASLNVTKDCYGIFLSEIILSRIPDKIKIQFAQTAVDEQTLETLITLIEQHIKSLELIKNTSLKPLEKHKSKPFSSFATGNETRNNSNINNTTNTPYNRNLNISNSTSFNRKCNLCKNIGHSTAYCELYKSCDTVQKRWDIIKKHHLCSNCLGSHSYNQCFSTKGCSICNLWHHTSLHLKDYNNSKANSSINSSNNETQQTTSNAGIANNAHVYLPIIPIELITINNSTCTIGALLDSGSQLSFIDEEILNSIRYSLIQTKSLNICGFNGSKSSGIFKEISCSATNGMILNFIAMKNVCQNMNTNTPKTSYKLPDGQLIHPCNLPVKIIIGNDQFHKIKTGITFKYDENLAFLQTEFGWAIQGTQEIDSYCNSFGNFITDAERSINIEEFWKVDNLREENELTENDILKNFENSIHMKNNRYIVKFPWKPGKLFTESYLSMAQNRFNSVIRKLFKEKMLEEYDNIFREYLKLDIIEEVQKIDSENPVRIIPHHPVIRRDRETTKVRIVMDASAKLGKNDYSLNECLHEGANLLPNLVGVLLRFRKYQYAATADIEKAFLQIEIDETDRDAVRFLWFRNSPCNNQFPSEKPIQYRMKRVPFGVSSSPFLLCATIKHHLSLKRDEFPRTVNLLENNLYMDDFVFSAPSHDKINEIKSEAIEVFRQMNMNMTKWRTNGAENENSAIKLLGIHWNPKLDQLLLKFKSSDDMITTKRQLASIVCSFWDPLGYFCPFVIKWKMILQQAWKQKISWDEPLPDELISTVKLLQSSLNKNCEVCIPRAIATSYDHFEYHVYCDASSKAYAASVYVHLFLGGEMIESKLLIAKSHLAPIKPTTIPRLELMAASLAVKLISFVKKEYENVDVVQAYSDSKVVLCWIKNEEKLWKEYIQNRVTKIRKIVSPNYWNYIPSKLNPADIATRGTTLHSLKTEWRWWTDINITKDDFTYENEDDICQNMEANRELKHHTFTITNENNVMDLHRYSSYSHVINVMAYLLRFINRAKKMDVPNSLVLSPIERHNAEKRLIYMVQSQYFNAELNALKNNGSIEKSSSLYALNPLIIDKLLCVNTRLQNSGLSYSQIYPIIIPKKTKLAELIILDAHKRLLHAGIGTIITSIRNKYWIINARPLIKSIINSCKICARYKVKSRSERWAPLPIDRIDTKSFRAFKNVGVDFTGPITLSSNKYYILLITCLQTRAIHLELTMSMDVTSFINAFTRFLCRRGIPSSVWSDNAKTFKSASGKLSTTHSLSWHFITEQSPHMGGAWERLIRSIKQPLYATLRSISSDYISLYTHICKIECTINSRPLTSTSFDHNEINAITPNDILLPHTLELNNSLYLSNEILLKLLLQNDELLKSFFLRWKSEYIVQVLKTGAQNKIDRLKVGDIVLVDNGEHRYNWPLGKIMEIKYSSDGIARTFNVKIKNKIYRRGLNKLYLLESSS